MSFILGWVRDLIGIRNDLREAKKTGLEIKKLETEAKSRESLIHSPSTDDVSKYDPKIQRLRSRIERRSNAREAPRYTVHWAARPLLLLIIIALLAAGALFLFGRRLF